MEGDIRCSKAAAGFADLYHRAVTVDAGLTGQLVVVTFIADHFDGRAVTTADGKAKSLVDLHSVKDTQYVAFLIYLSA